MKKCISIFLIAVLLFGTVASFFFADAETGTALKNCAVGDTFTVGLWPQSLVEDEALSAVLNEQEVTMYQYGFACGLSNTVGGKVIEQGLDYPKVDHLVQMYYGDIVYAGAKYRKVVVNEMRPEQIDSTTRGNEAMIGTYYFKWEPIEWILLEKIAPAHSGQDMRIRAVTKNILSYGYLFNEITRENTDYSRRELNQLAFCRADINATYNWSVNFGYFGSYYNSEATLAGFSAFLSTPEQGYLAPVSHYAQLVGADERLMNETQRENAAAPWGVFSDTLVNAAGEYVDVSEQDEHVSYKAVRPTCEFRGNYIPAQQPIANYPAEHEHSYNRNCYTPEALALEANCHQNEVYYFSCDCCGQLHPSGTFTAPTRYFEHTPVKIYSHAARKYAANGVNPGTYYYTCSVCGDVLRKGDTFPFTGTCQEHDYVWNSSESSANCLKAGTAVWHCYNCFDKIEAVYTEPMGHEWNMDVVYQKTTRSPANCSANSTYYNVYKCTRCSQTYTDTSRYYENENTINPNAHVYSEVAFKKEPTCTEVGYTEYRCKYCEATTIQSLVSLGHDEAGQAQNGYSLLTPATCTEDAVYYHTCSRCDKPSEQTYTARGTALGHNYTQKKISPDTLRTAAQGEEPATYYYSCINCGAVLRENNKYFYANEYKPYVRNRVEAGETIEFGSWPQSAVTDAELLERLNAQSVSLQSYKYRYTTAFGNYYIYINMRYGDVTLDGERYRKVYIGSYRSSDLLLIPGLGTNYQQNNQYIQGGTYWFKWEPIRWRVQRIQNDTATLICENVLDAQTYLDDYSLYYETTWGNSTLRRWLNDTFFHTAFLDSEQEQVPEQEVYTCDNYDYDITGGGTTTDKVLIPALEDVEDVSLNIAPQTAGTDYALSQGLCAIGTEHASWVTRTPSYNQNGVVYMSETGRIVNDEAANVTGVWGVRPMLRISLLAGYKSEDVNEDGVIDLADVSLLLQYFGEQNTYHDTYDLNDNGCIDIQDLSMMLRCGFYGKKK